MSLPFSDLNLEPIIIKAIDADEGLGWELDFAIKVSEEYKKFLFMCKMNDDKAIVPSSVVDDFWHLHILDTQKYYADCELFLGYFLHHFPYFGMRSEEDAQNLKTAWENTLAIYEEYFGAPNSTIWKGSNRCPNCGVRCRSKGVLAFDESRPTFKSLNISI